MKLPNIIIKYLANKDYRLDEIGRSDANVLILDDSVLKIQPVSLESENEVQMLHWLNGKICVPKVIEHICENGYSYLLMTKCAGEMSCSDKYMAKPLKQAELLAEVLHQLWCLPTADCPCIWSLEKRLQQAEQNVLAGNVDIADAQPETFGSNGFHNPEELLRWLIDKKPDETAVVSHGDFCLPNVFLNEHGLTGLIDLGKAGMADRWQDIALCFRSLSNNYNGVYGGRKYPGFQDSMLFDALGIHPDWEMIRYYILLDELF